MAEQIGIEISAKDLTGQAFAAVNKNLESIRESTAAVAQSNGQMAASADKAAGMAGNLMAIVAGSVSAAGVLKVASAIQEYGAAVQKSVGALGDLSVGLGYTTDQLQAYISTFGAAGYSQDQTATSLTKFNGVVASAAKGNGDAIASFHALGVKLLDATGKVRPLSELMAESAAKLQLVQDGAQRTALSMQLFNASGSQLAPVLRELSGGIDYMVDRAKDLGTVATPEVIAAFEKLNKTSNALELQVRTLYGSLAAPIQIAAVDTAATAFARLSEHLGAAAINWRTLLLYISNPISTTAALAAIGLQPTALEKADKDVANLTESIRSLNEQMADGATSQQTMARLKEQLGIEQKLLATAEMRAQELHQGAAAKIVMPPVNVTAGALEPTSTGKSGGSGGDKRDRIAEAIARLQGETKAAQDALNKMVEGARAGLPLKAVEDAATLQKKIDDQIAKLGRYNPKDPRIEQLKQDVALQQQAEAALRQRTEAEKNAVDIEKQLGDGTAFLAIETQRLNEAYATGRLSLDAYIAKMKEAKEKADDMGRATRGAQGGIGGFMAGMQQAAATQARGMTTFKAGEQAYNDTFALLKTTTTDWVNTGVLDMQKFETAFLSMLANVGLALVQSELIKLLGGAAGAAGGGGGGGIGGMIVGLVGSLFGGAVGGGLGNVPIGAFSGGAFASGGNPPVGMASLVGEQGPELFVPSTPGTIISNDNLARMGPSDSGAVMVTMNNHWGSDVSRAEMEARLAQVEASAKKGAIAGLVEARRSGQYRGDFKR
jgi:hypothetical protein